MSERVVLKFGGTSMGDQDRIARAARHAVEAADAGAGVCVVVSAMAGDTDRLIGLANGACPGAAHASGANYDLIVAAGEQVSAGLLALTLTRMGRRARAWTGPQAGVTTDREHARARIDAINANGLASAVDTGEIAVVTGFQGATPDGRVATLGRGGSDTSAVAMAAALQASRCDIFTDVDGVYTTDPRVEKRARRLDQISYEEMLEMASLGAKVLQTRSVELAMAKRVPLRVVSSFVEPGQPNPGTWLCDEDAIMEKRVVSGIAYSRDEARVTILGVEDRPGSAADVFGYLRDLNVNVDMIVQSRPRGEAAAANISFTIGQNDVERTLAALDRAKPQLGFVSHETKTDLAKVSVVGVGMRSHSGVAHTMFQALADKGISIDSISTSEIKISVLIDSEYTELAVRALHSAYALHEA